MADVHRHDDLLRRSVSRPPWHRSSDDGSLARTVQSLAVRSGSCFLCQMRVGRFVRNGKSARVLFQRPSCSCRLRPVRRHAWERLARALSWRAVFAAMLVLSRHSEWVALVFPKHAQHQTNARPMPRVLSTTDHSCGTSASPPTHSSARGLSRYVNIPHSSPAVASALWPASATAGILFSGHCAE